MSVSIDRKAGEVARLRTDESGRGPILQRTCLALLVFEWAERFGPGVPRLWQSMASQSQPKTRMSARRIQRPGRSRSCMRRMPAVRAGIRWTSVPRSLSSRRR